MESKYKSELDVLRQKLREQNEENISLAEQIKIMEQSKIQQKMEV